MFGLVRYRAEDVYIRDCMTVSVMDSVFLPLRFPFSISNCFDYQRLFCTVAVGGFCFECACVCVRAWMSECKMVEREKRLNCTEGWRYRWPDFYSTWLYERMLTTSHFAICFLVSFAPVHYLIFNTVAYRPFSCDLSHALHRGNRPKPPPRLLKQRPISHSSVSLFFVLFWGVFILQFSVCPHTTGTKLLYLIKWKMFIKMHHVLISMSKICHALRPFCLPLNCLLEHPNALDSKQVEIYS